jgi:serine/threonine-protein kinase
VQTATADPLVGRLLEGRYRIVHRIARGGMSTVYAALDERLDRRVAVKVMASALSADPAFSDRFAREARAAARLAHINAVAVYDQGYDAPSGGHVFLVMELVPGRTLRDLIRERTSAHGRFSPAEAISIMEPVLSALSAAHRAGLVHRDVKPENILLSDDGVVKVADFGLARAIDADAASTRTGLMMGTVAYCAPEQIVHGRCDQRSDVYSAAIVLFELLTGSPPYRGDSAMTVAYQHVHSRVPAPSSRIRERPSGIPTLIDEIVVAASDSDPDGRPADASAFLAEIADARAELALPIVPVPRRRPVPNGAGRYGGSGGGGGAGGAGGAAVASSTEVIRNGTPGPHDTEIVHRTPLRAPGPPGQPGPLGPPGPPRSPAPPPVVIPPSQRGSSPKTRRRRRRIILLIAVLLLGALSVLGGYGGVKVWREQNTHVPQVDGYAVSAATAKLHDTGYAVDSKVTNEFSETVDKGEVIRTDPGGGARLAQGKPVHLVVSLGQDRVAVPDVANMALSDAETLLQSHGLSFNPTPRTRHSVKVKQGRVIVTDPAAGAQIKRSQQIGFIVSSGPPMVTVPKIAPGTPYDQAEKALKKAHLEASRVDEYNDTIPAGTVVSVDPSGQVSYGGTVTVTVSKGPEFVTIPDFAPLSPVEDVQAKLQSLHLNVVVVRAFGGTQGRVIKIDPGAGTQVHPGDTVTLTVV